MRRGGCGRGTHGVAKNGSKLSERGFVRRLPLHLEVPEGLEYRFSAANVPAQTGGVVERVDGFRCVRVETERLRGNGKQKDELEAGKSPEFSEVHCIIIMPLGITPADLRSR